MSVNEPIFDIAEAHVELLTPELERTLWFFTDLLRMQETEQRGGSVRLRGYEEQYHHSLEVAPRAAGACRLACPQPASPGVKLQVQPRRSQ